MRFLSFLIFVFAVLGLVQAQDQSGFISLDCGLVPTEITYVEKSTNITYRSDATYIDSGVPGKINEVYRTQFQQQIWALRSFPEGQRNCYNFSLTAKRKYLIRGTFIYGNYDGLNQLPSFDLYIGPNKWTSVSIPGVRNGSVSEMIHVLRQDHLQICLVKTGETTPFISSLELRPLNNNTYVTKSGSLIVVARLYFSPTPPFLRYDEDVHDRIWIPFLDNKNSLLSTELSVDTSNFYNVPQTVAKTAAVPLNATQPLKINWSLDDITSQSYIYMHFAEIENLEANETREFNITYNGGENWFSYFRPPKFRITTVYNPAAVSSLDGNFNFTFSMTGNSTHPPLINGLEIYQVLELPQLDTYQDEVSAMMNIKTIYGLSKRSSWQGDPCAPELYRWEGLNCSYPNFAPPQIISLNLSGNKNLNRSVPETLQKRIDNKSLTLIRDETGKNSTNVVAIAASVASVFAVLVILAIVFVVIRKKQRTNEASGPRSFTTGTVKSDARSSSSSIITKERKFTYSEVLKMTKNFERVLGKGGFGTVYHGNLDDTQVAVKMLSHSSAQGYKEFKAEVELLLRVHHRHLVGLVGYCDDGDNLALIYEYMEKGDLRENMSGKHSVNVLSWETRMQIAVEAAQGLEYLHNGCRPPMVHRDVKPTNILLNERSQAKLADFGLSRSFPVDGESHVMTVVAGTPGYLDPEYYRTNWLSEKSDVYSFGVVLLEIVTNQPVMNKNRERPHINEWVMFMLTNGDIKSIVDPKLNEDYDTNGVWKVVELALACVNPSSSRRPTMPHVVMELNECLALEIERKQGSQATYIKESVEFSPSSASDFSPLAR
uniref:Isoform 2 of Probable LRR receptor-like protein kinase At1g51890 n=1 Tax=Arabidopsis thaliana TaxID=3702 RepID=C0LGG6-2